MAALSRGETINQFKPVNPSDRADFKYSALGDTGHPLGGTSSEGGIPQHIGFKQDP